MDKESFVASVLSPKLHQSITAEHLARASGLGLDAGKVEWRLALPEAKAKTGRTQCSRSGSLVLVIINHRRPQQD